MTKKSGKKQLKKKLGPVRPRRGLAVRRRSDRHVAGLLLARAPRVGWAVSLPAAHALRAGRWHGTVRFWSRCPADSAAERERRDGLWRARQPAPRKSGSAASPLFPPLPPHGPARGQPDWARGEPLASSPPIFVLGPAVTANSSSLGITARQAPSATTARLLDWFGGL